MSSQTSTADSIRVYAQNIGGIDETSVSLSRGVNVLTGRNATNRTSFLQAVMAAMGSERVSLKGDADEGLVKLSIDDETFIRRLERTGSEVHMSGEPYLSDPTKADLFAFLLEENEARRAVARGDGLHEIIMRPVDTEEIQAEISRLKQRKNEIDTEIQEKNSLEQQLTEIESQRSSLESQIEEKERELKQKNRELQEADSSVAESREGKDELNEALGELKETRSELEDVKFRLETNRQSLEDIENEQERLESTLEELPEPTGRELGDIADRIEELRTQRREIDNTLGDLQSVIEFNENMLGDTSTEVLEALRDNTHQQSVTDQLVDDAVVCWTCGSPVERTNIEETLRELRDLQEEKVSEREEIQTEIDELTEERSELQAQDNDRKRIKQQLQEVENERENLRSSIKRLERRWDELKETIDDLGKQVENLEEDIQSEILNRHREVNQLEFELEQLNSELADTLSEIDSIESRLNEREKLEQEREEVQRQLDEQRGRIGRIKQDAVEQFNEHMMEVLELLDYSNLERIWIEQVQKEVREGRRKAIKDTFELHVVRTTESGTTYEDTINHLSESEREITGLIFALAGYLVHDVHEHLPVLLLDSLEAIDSERIAELIEYLEAYADCLVVALLPEDASALDDRHQRVSDI